jgi:outer membrane protein, multidrug efflux system
VAADPFNVYTRAVDARHRSGFASLFELEEARRNALVAQNALIDLRRDRVAAWIALYRALGGGWTGADGGPFATAEPADPSAPRQ